MEEYRRGMVNTSKTWTPKGKVATFINPHTGVTTRKPDPQLSYDYQLNWIQAGQALSQLFQLREEAEEVAEWLRDKYAAPTHIGERGDYSWLEANNPQEIEF